MEPGAEFAQLPGGFVDQSQGRDAVIRPLVLFADRPATPRAQETQTHPDTVRTLARHFRQPGRLGVVPATLAVESQGSARSLPDAVRQEMDRLQALSTGLHSRALARLIGGQLGEAIDPKTVKPLWPPSPVVAPAGLALGGLPSPAPA